MHCRLYVLQVARMQVHILLPVQSLQAQDQFLSYNTSTSSDDGLIILVIPLDLANYYVVVFERRSLIGATSDRFAGCYLCLDWSTSGGSASGR